MSYGVTKRMQTPVVRKLKPQEKLNKVAEVFSKSPFCIILLGFFENTFGQNARGSLPKDARLLSPDIGTGRTLRTHSAALIGTFRRTLGACASRESHLPTVLPTVRARDRDKEARGKTARLPRSQLHDLTTRRLLVGSGLCGSVEACSEEDHFISALRKTPHCSRPTTAFPGNRTCGCHR